MFASTRIRSPASRFTANRPASSSGATPSITTRQRPSAGFGEAGRDAGLLPGDAGEGDAEDFVAAGDEARRRAPADDAVDEDAVDEEDGVAAAAPRPASVPFRPALFPPAPAGAAVASPGAPVCFVPAVAEPARALPCVAPACEAAFFVFFKGSAVLVVIARGMVCVSVWIRPRGRPGPRPNL
jgi:hypothetical protein